MEIRDNTLRAGGNCPAVPGKNKYLRAYMTQSVEFIADLIGRYDPAEPRYTSYPAVSCFKDGVTEDDYRKWAKNSNEDPIPRPLSLYVHIPFCDDMCFFCASNTVVVEEHSTVAVYLKRLGREIAMQAALFDKDRIVDQLHWGGGTPTFLSGDEIRELMAVTRRHFSLRTDSKREYSVEIDPCTVDRDRLLALRDAGFNQASLGVQDVAPDVQKALNRTQCLDMTRGVTRMVRDLGFKSVNMDLMYGLPCQTVKGFQKTLRAVTELQPDRLAVYNYAHLPARIKPRIPINESDLPGADEMLDILQFTIDHLTVAGYVYIGMDHFARPDDDLLRAQRNGTLHRNFQGYSTHYDCDLIGLGVSAISKVCDNYSQNVRELDAYNKRIGSGRFAIEQGIELEPDDLLRAEIINQLICYFSVDIEALEKNRQFSFSRHISSEMRALLKMQEDGLITLDRKFLQVLPAGRLLVRSVCKVFDRYLHDGNADLSRAV